MLPGGNASSALEEIVVVVGLWAMWVLWTVTPVHQHGNRVAAVDDDHVPEFQGLRRPTRHSGDETVQLELVALSFTVIGAVLLVAASTMILRTPRSVDEI